jgi:pimeloyl-ACP methyl ester carboxylesterase
MNDLGDPGPSRWRRFKRRVLKWTLILLAVLLAVAGVATWLAQTWDPARVIYKRLKAPSPYWYEEVPPAIQAVDPARLIQPDGPAAARALRADLRETVLGPDLLTPDGLAERLPEVEALPAQPVRGLIGLPPLARVERLTLPFEFNYAATAYHLVPETWNGRAVVYAHGYAGDIGQASPLIAALLEAGYAVVAQHFPGYGEVGLGAFNHPRFGPIDLGNDRQLLYIDHALRSYVEPLLAARAHLAARHGVDRVAVIGFSAGGWAATLARALDPRFRLTVSVAGIYPLYMRSSKSDFAPPTVHPPLLRVINYPSMFTLATLGEAGDPTRPAGAYVQIFNRYDRCCYRNTFGKLYEPAVQQAAARIGGGPFEVLIDESHADHKVSDWAIRAILQRLSTAMQDGGG